MKSQVYKTLVKNINCCNFESQMQSTLSKNLFRLSEVASYLQKYCISYHDLYI